MGRVSWGCSRTVLEKPTTPRTPGANLAGSCTAEALEKYVIPFGLRYVRRLVLNAAATVLLDPLARTRKGDDDCSTINPLARKYPATAAFCALPGAKSESNCPLP